MRKIFAILIMLLAFVSCNDKQDEMDPVILQKEEVCLKVKDSIVFEHVSFQSGYTVSKGLYWAVTDGGAEYFKIYAKKPIPNVGETFDADVRWTYKGAEQLLENVRFTVEKTENGLTWIWSAKSSVNAVIMTSI